MSSIEEMIAKNWTNRDVTDWLRGIDETVLPVVHFFFNAQVTGKDLLLMDRDDLQSLGITQIGVRTLISQALGLLGNLCYNLDTENLQFIALSVSVQANSVIKLLERAYHNESADRVNIVQLNHLFSSLSKLTDEVKNMVIWLNRPPFSEMRVYGDIRRSLLQLITEIINIGTVQTTFKVKSALETKCSNVTDICEQIVQNSTDPLITQTAYLDRAILRRKSATDDLGFHIESNFCGVHVVSAINAETPAYFCQKLSEGDELVQIGGQIVVGWQLSRLVKLLRSIRSKEVELLVKKRPKDVYQLGKGNATPRRLRPPPTPYSAAPFDNRHKAKVPTVTQFQQEFTTQPLLDSDNGKVKLRRRSSSIGNLQSPIERTANWLTAFDSKAGSKCSTPTSKTSTPTSPFFPIIKIDSPMEVGLPTTTGTSRIRRTTVSGGSPVFRRLSLNTPVETAAPRRQTDWFQVEVPQRPIGEAFKFGTLCAPDGDKKPFLHMFSHHRISYDGNQLIIPKKMSLSSTSSSDSAELFATDLPSPGIINLQPPPKSRKQTGNTSSSGQTESTSGGSKMSGSEARSSVQLPLVERQSSAVEPVEVEDDVFVTTVKIRPNAIEPIGSLSQDHLEDFSQIEVVSSSANADDEWFDPRHKSLASTRDELSTTDDVGKGSETLSLRSDQLTESPKSFEDLQTPMSAIPPELLSKLPHMSQEKLRKFFGESTESPTTSRPTSPLVSGRSTPLSGTPSGGRRAKVPRTSESHFTPIKDFQFFFHKRVAGVDSASPMHKISAAELQHPGDSGNSKVAGHLSSSSFTAADVRSKAKLSPAASAASASLMVRSFIPCKSQTEVIHQGWLYRARRKDVTYAGRNPADKWVKCWAVLRRSHLYFYRTPEAERAEGIIRLAGFIACDAGSAYKTSRKNVFKLELKSMEDVATSFFLSCDKHTDMITWLNHLGLVIIGYEGADNAITPEDEETHFHFNDEVEREDTQSTSQWYVPSAASTLPRLRPNQPYPASSEVDETDLSTKTKGIEAGLPPRSSSNVSSKLRKSSFRRFKKRSVGEDSQPELNIDKNANRTSYPEGDNYK